MAAAWPNALLAPHALLANHCCTPVAQSNPKHLSQGKGKATGWEDRDSPARGRGGAVTQQSQFLRVWFSPDVSFGAKAKFYTYNTCISNTPSIFHFQQTISRQWACHWPQDHRAWVSPHHGQASQAVATKGTTPRTQEVFSALPSKGGMLLSQTCLHYCWAVILITICITWWCICTCYLYIIYNIYCPLSSSRTSRGTLLLWVHAATWQPSAPVSEAWEGRVL